MPIRNNKSPSGGNIPSEPPHDAVQNSNSANIQQNLSEHFFSRAFLGIMALAILVRVVVLLTREAFSGDEYATMLVVLSPNGILQTLANSDNHPPLYYLLLKGWINFFGIQEHAVRSLSMLLGIAAVGVFPFWLRELGLSRRAALWGMMLFALAGMQVQFSTEARDYMFGCLLEVLCLYCYTAAIRRQSPPHWIAFGIFLLLSFYTHHLLVPFAGAYLLAAWILGASRRSWIWLLAVLAADALLYLPGFELLRTQIRTNAHNLDWISTLWTQQHLIIYAIPDSLQHLSLMGNYSDLIKHGFIRRCVIAGSVVGCLLAVILALVPTRRMFCKFFQIEITNVADNAQVCVLLLFCFYDLIFLYLYSLLHMPLYVVGRYDFFSQPGFLALLAVGIAQFQQALSCKNAWFGRLAPLSLTALVCIPCLANASHPFDIDDLYTKRSEVLAQYVQPGDIVIATWGDLKGLEYEQYLHHIPVIIVSFPLRPSGESALTDNRVFSPSNLNEQANSIINIFNHSGSKNHIWLAYNPNVSLSFHDSFFAAKVFSSLADHSGLQRWQPGPDGNNITNQLFMIAWKHKP
ncbi:MAG TPA: glycosyltransferase family 39 protein [Phycisphaerae bacterium]|nr:glycosyltransferase family 39 protein [Phycisphaerae bacterium]